MGRRKVDVKNKRRRRSRRSRSASAESGDYASFLLSHGLRYAKYRRPRKVSRNPDSQPARPTSRDKYGATADRLCDMEDQEDRKAGGMANLEQFAVFAIRGFGLHKVDLCIGTYGYEPDSSFRRQRRTERDYIWNKNENPYRKSDCKSRFRRKVWKYRW